MATLTSSIVRQQSHYRLWLHWRHPLSDSSHITGYGYTDIVHCQTAVTGHVMTTLTSSIVRQQSHYRLWLHWHRPLSDSSNITGYGYTDIVHCQTAVTIQVIATLTSSTVSSHTNAFSQTAFKPSLPHHMWGVTFQVRTAREDNKFSIRNNSISEENWVEERWQTIIVLWPILWNAKGLFYLEMPENKKVYSTWECQILPWKKGLFYFAKGLFYLEMPKNKKVCSTLECQMQFNSFFFKWVSDR